MLGEGRWFYYVGKSELLKVFDLRVLLELRLRKISLIICIKRFGCREINLKIIIIV